MLIFSAEIIVIILFRILLKKWYNTCQGQMPVQLHAASNVTTSYTGRVPQQFSFALWTHDEKLQTNTNKRRWQFLIFFPPHILFLVRAYISQKTTWRFRCHMLVEFYAAEICSSHLFVTSDLVVFHHLESSHCPGATTCFIQPLQHTKSKKVCIVGQVCHICSPLAKEVIYSMYAGTHGLSLCSQWNRIQVVLYVLGCFLVHREQRAHSTTAAAVHSPDAAFAWRAIKLLSRKKQILALRLRCSLELGYSRYPVLEVQHSHHQRQRWLMGVVTQKNTTKQSFTV